MFSVVVAVSLPPAVTIKKNLIVVVDRSPWDKLKKGGAGTNGTTGLQSLSLICCDPYKHSLPTPSLFFVPSFVLSFQISIL